MQNTVLCSCECSLNIDLIFMRARTMSNSITFPLSQSKLDFLIAYILTLQKGKHTYLWHCSCFDQPLLAVQESYFPSFSITYSTNAWLICRLSSTRKKCRLLADLEDIGIRLHMLWNLKKLISMSESKRLNGQYFVKVTGQLTLKCLLGIFNSPKKITKKVDFTS